MDGVEILTIMVALLAVNAPFYYKIGVLDQKVRNVEQKVKEMWSIITKGGKKCQH